MAKFIGRQQSIGIGREVTRGTLVTPGLWMPKTNYTLEDKILKGIFQGNYGVPAGGDEAIVSQRWSEGDIEFEVTDQAIGYFLYALFGTLTTSSFNSVFKHTLTLNNSVQHQSLSVMVNDPIGAAENPTKTLAYSLAMLNTFNMNFELGELVMATANFIAKRHVDFTRQTASYTAENKFAHHNLTFKIAANEAALDAAAKINLESLSINIGKDVVKHNALGTVQPIDILNRTIKISGQIKLAYEDRTYRDYMLDGTKKAVRITLNRPDVTIGATTPQIQIDLPIVHFEGWEPSNANDDVAMQELTFTALYDVTNSKIIGTNTFVVNAKTSY